MKRFYAFDGILNFRDFGGYENRYGRQLKPRRLFRSANFHRASEADLEHLAALDIGLRVDLRYLNERQRQPNKWHDPHRTLFLELPDDDTDNPQIAPHEMFIREELHAPEDARNYMKSSYERRPEDPVFRDIFSGTLKHMAQSPDPVVIHCAAGKDRTGTLAAIILACLDVDADTVMNDYMLTMEAVDVESFLEPAAKMIAERHGRDYSVDALRPMFGVEPAYLKKSLTAIGDIDRYIGETLNISDRERAAIQQNFLE